MLHREKHILTIYLVTSKQVASAISVANRGDKQVPIYFFIQILHGAEIGYSDMEKLSLSLVNAARQLRRYFLVHMIEVLNKSPIRQVLLKSEK